jgi:PST family polysaccharide transporter
VRRVKTSVLLHATLGVAGFVGLSLLGPFLSRALFGPALAIPQAASVALGLFYLLWSIETVTGRHVLATRGETRTLLVTTCVGSAIGVPAIAAAARLAGAIGASWGLAGALALIVLLQSAATLRIIRRNATE